MGKKTGLTMFGVRVGAKPLIGMLVAACLGALSTAANAAPSKFEVLEEVFRSYQGEIECLARAIYFEARSEPLAGQFAVARVILNRVDSAYYPGTVCDVVYQNDHMHNACQFSFACDGIAETIAEPDAYEVARQISVNTFQCDSECRVTRGELARSTHYHADYVEKVRRQSLSLRHLYWNSVYFQCSRR